MSRARHLGLGLLAGVLAASLGGCVVYHAVATPVKLAATGVVVAGEAATAVVTSTGKVATSAVKAVGKVGSTGIDSIAKLTEAGMVTFVDGASGAVVRVPWQEGLTVAAAGDNARLSLARRTLDVVRAGRVVRSENGERAATIPASSGDVIRVNG